MAPMYYRGAKAAILVFDVSNEESFHNSKSWLKDLKSHADQDVVVCIAGNKCDKEPGFDLKQCEEFAKSVDATFIKTSAQTGEGVTKLFSELTKRIVEVYKNKSINGTNNNSNSYNRNNNQDDTLILDGKSNHPSDGGCC